MPQISVHQIDVMKEATWSFRDENPLWRHPKHKWYLTASFDVFPAYAHQAIYVIDTASDVQAACPPIWDVEIYLADREERARTNGHSNLYEAHSGDDEPNLGLVMLSGKRIPPHPAMTRYLVAHEYGHHVEWMTGHLRGEDRPRNGEWLDEYARMRGLDPAVVGHHGEGGSWHDSIHEIFACDFRVMVTGVEENYWPHPGIPHPTTCDQYHKLRVWWNETVEMFKSHA